MTEEPILELRNVTRTFPGVIAMDDVSIGFRAGEVHAVIGENGAGKSTMMNLLAGELQPDKGSILVDGQSRDIPSALASQQLGIRIVFQELSLCQNLTVGENVLLSAFADRPPLSFLTRNRAAGAAAASCAWGFRTGVSRRSARSSTQRIDSSSSTTQTFMTRYPTGDKWKKWFRRAASDTRSCPRDGAPDNGQWADPGPSLRGGW